MRALNKFELSLFDPVRDVDNSPYGGQCLSFMSFKVIPSREKTLTLTAMYRNHFYIEKLLGNLIGLGRLMDFVAHEAGLEVGALTVISTHAEIDQPRRQRKACQPVRHCCADRAVRSGSSPSRGLRVGEGKLERLSVVMAGCQTVDAIDARVELGLAAITWMADDLDCYI